MPAAVRRSVGEVKTTSKQFAPAGGRGCFGCTGTRRLTLVLDLLLMRPAREGFARERRAITVQSLRYTPLGQPIVIGLGRGLHRAAAKGCRCARFNTVSHAACPQ